MMGSEARTDGYCSGGQTSGEAAGRSGAPKGRREVGVSALGDRLNRSVTVIGLLPGGVLVSEADGMPLCMLVLFVHTAGLAWGDFCIIERMQPIITYDKIEEAA